MKKKIEIPRHPELGVVVTMVVDIGQHYHINQKVIGDEMLKLSKEQMDELFSETFKRVSYEMLKYLIDNGIIVKPN